MINLLSTDNKSAIRAARSNVILLRYIGIIVVAIVFLMSVLYVSYMLLEQTNTTAEARISASDVKADVYSTTKEQVNALSNKLTDAKLTLDQEVSYAQILTRIGQAMPQGAILGELTLDETALNTATPVDVAAYAKNEETAALIQQQLRSTGFVSNVELTGTAADTTIADYPIKVSMKLTFNRSVL